MASNELEDFPQAVCVLRQIAEEIGFNSIERDHDLTYNSTNLCFAYFGFSPGGTPGKRKPCLLFYRRPRSRASRNYSTKFASSCDCAITVCAPRRRTSAGFDGIFFSTVKGILVSSTRNMCRNF